MRLSTELSKKQQFRQIESFVNIFLRPVRDYWGIGDERSMDIIRMLPSSGI
jgi:hypothetical protein